MKAMSKEETYALRASIIKRLSDSDLSLIQVVKLEEIKSKTGDYIPNNKINAIIDIENLFDANNYEGLLSIVGKLASGEGDSEGIKVRMENGKIITINQYMNLYDNAFLKGNTLPTAKEFIGSDIPDSSSYSKLSEEEYKASAFGSLNYVNGLVYSTSNHAFRFVKEDLYREEILEVDKVYTLEEWQELMNSLHPCLMASYFYSSDIVLKFFGYLEDEYIISNPGGGKVALNFEDMCSHFK